MTPLVVSVLEAAQMLGCKRTKMFQLIKEERVSTIKLGRLTRVTTESLRALVANGGAA